MGYAVALAAGFVFGAADQYLGSRSALGAWAAVVSLVSAPWLLIGFVGGLTQSVARKAMIVAVLVTVPALLGYFTMTCSPMEGVAAARFPQCLSTVARTGYNPLWILGAVLLAPLYGLLGHRWRVARSWTSAAVVAGTLCLEPLAHLSFDPWMLSAAPVVWWAEVTLGLVLAAVLARGIVMARRAGGASPPPF